MKRIIAASVSLSLILVSAPLPAWSQVSSAMTGSASGVSGSAAGAARNAAIPQLALPALGLAAPSLSGALAAPMDVPTAVVLEIGQFGSYAAEVAWADYPVFGLRFKESPETMVEMITAVALHA